MLLYFLLGKGNYTDEEKYIIMVNTFMGKVNDWFSGLTEDSEKIIKNDTLEGFKNSIQEGIANLKQYVANEFFGGQGNIKENKEANTYCVCSAVHPSLLDFLINFCKTVRK